MKLPKLKGYKILKKNGEYKYFPLTKITEENEKITHEKHSCDEITCDNCFIYSPPKIVNCRIRQSKIAKEKNIKLIPMETK